MEKLKEKLVDQFKKITLNDLAVAIVLFIACATLICIMFMQFKTVEETDIADLESMRETELRTALSEWKTKYDTVASELADTEKKINEYNDKIGNDDDAEKLINKELQQSNLILGKTDVFGEGIVVTLRDNDIKKISANDLIELVNELRYAGAEAISINDIRIIQTTSIVDIDDKYINIDGRRIASPYIVKTIGNQTYLSSVLNMKNSGFIDRYTSDNYSVEYEMRKRVEILKYNGEIVANHLMEGEE